MFVRGLTHWLWLFVLSFSVPASALSLHEQREIYQKGRQAVLDRDWDLYQQTHSQLKDYPLRPYLEFHAIQRDFSRYDMVDIRQWIDQNQGIPLANTLEHRYLTLLGQQRRWKDYLRFYPQEPNSIQLRCYYFRAHLAEGATQATEEGVRDIWLSGRSRPDACDPLFQWMADEGELTDQLVWDRMELAFQAGQPGLLNYLQEKIDNQALAKVGERMVRTYQSPKRLLKFDEYPNGGRHSRGVVWLGMSRLSRQDPASGLEACELYLNCV